MRARAAILVLCALAAGCHKRAPEELNTQAAVPVEVAVAHLGAITASIRVTGTVEPAASGDLTVTAPQPARIAELKWSTGDRVPRGAVLVRFDSPPLRTDLATRAGELAQAQARLENARRNHARLTELLAKGIASRKEVEDAQRELGEAEAAVRQGHQTHSAAADLFSRATPVAPFDGIVAQRWHATGDLIDVNEHVLRFVDPRHLEVTAAVPVGDAARVVIGRPARVTTPSSSAETSLQATVAGGAGAADPVTGTAMVRLKLVGALPVGTPVQVEIAAEERTNVLIVPAAAVVKNEQETIVYVVGADQHAHRRPVVVGLTTPEEVVIVSGLQPGDKVVVKGNEELPDGALVTVETAGKE